MLFRNQQKSIKTHLIKPESRSSLCSCFLKRSLTPKSSRAPEILFKPDLIGRDHCGIHESLYKSILSSDIDLRRSLLQNIVLSGKFFFSAFSHDSMCPPHPSCGGRFYSFLFVHIPVHFTSKCLKGGNTLLSGFPERLQAEIKGLLGPDTGENVHVSSPEDRVFSVWSGGAMLANLQTFSLAWISLEEYEEQGPQIVHRKCF